MVVHGGPDFDHCYFLPELDRLGGLVPPRLLRPARPRQVGRGRPVRRTSRSGPRSRTSTGCGATSGWSRSPCSGTRGEASLAMEYAIRHPERVSHLILLDTGSGVGGRLAELRESFAAARPAEDRRDAGDRATDAYARGDLEAEAAYYRIHFRMTLRRPDLLEALVARLRCELHARRASSSRGRSSIGSTRRRPSSADWDLFPALRRLDVPTLVLHGEHDFVPSSWPRGSRRRCRARACRCCPAAATSPTSRRRRRSSRRSPASAANRPTSSTRTRAASPSPRPARGRASPASSARSRGRARPGSGAAPARARRGRAGAPRAPARRRRGP